MRMRLRVLTLAAALPVLAALPTTAHAADGMQQPQLAFLSGNYYEEEAVQIYVANADGTGLANLSQGGIGGWYAWSPDGTRIGFLSSRDGTTRLYVVGLDGSPPLAIAEAATSPAPRWSPDGSRIAYRAGDGALRSIEVAGLTTVTLAPIGAGPTGGSLRWAPTGEHLLFESGSSLLLAAATGGAPRLVTDHFAGAAAWSPEGDRLLFTAEPQGNDDVYVVDTIGSAQPRQLTSGAADDESPAWSGDGSRIAYTSGLEIIVVDADGSNAVSATGGPLDLGTGDPTYTWSLSGLAWSPRGDDIAVVADRRGPTPLAHSFQAFLIDLASDAEPLEIDSGQGAGQVAWSPIGGQLAVQQNALVGPSIRVFDQEGMAVFALGSAAMAQWSPDTGYLAFTRGSAAPDGVWVVDADGSDPRQIGPAPGDPNAFSAAWRPQPAEPVGLVDPATGRWYLRDATGAIRSFYYGNPGDVPFMGDWDCDGVDTPGLYRRSDGYAYLRNSNTQGVADVSFFFGNPEDIPIAGDFDGDGCDTLSLYRPSEQAFYIIDHLGSGDAGLGAADARFVFGNPGDVPVVGDWDGDGIDEVGLHRPDTGFFYWRNTLTTGVGDGQIFFGDPGDRFIAGDWIDHDGRDTPAVFRPGAITFYFRETLTQGVADSQLVFGRSGWLPVSGDFG